jgi:Ni/Co efflux regulator RcnB
MKLISRLLIAVALLSTGSLALADKDHGDHDRRSQGHGDHDNRHDGHRNKHDDRRYDNRRVVYRDARRGYRGHQRWERGHRYSGPTYVVRDYGHYRLRQPPRGYRWVRADNDFLMVAIATGIILDIAIR